jgi:uncharacterized protein YecT (DUF1311 family)
MSMKIIKHIFFGTMVLYFCIGVVPAKAQSQMEMTQQAVNKYQQSAHELNKIYKQILKEYSTDTVFIKNLKSCQKIWIQFREAELQMKYPGIDYAGTSTAMCKAHLMEAITKARIKTLKVWLTGMTEGDVCSGTVKVKN